MQILDFKLNYDSLLHIGLFLNSKDLISLSNTDKMIYELSNQILKKRYQTIFGKISEDKLLINRESMIRLLFIANKQPDCSANYNRHQVPTDSEQEERWRFGIVGKLDRELQDSYKNAVSLLENTQVTSIEQLKSQIQAFWHLNAQVKDYLYFKIKYWNKDPIRKGKKFPADYLFTIFTRGINYKSLNKRSASLCAKIGAFQFNGINYNVVAFHHLIDNSLISTSCSHIYTFKKFYKSTYEGYTFIGCLEEGQPCSISQAYKNKGNFRIALARQDAKQQGVVFSEAANGKRVLEDKRYLNTSYQQVHNECTEKAQGSDRVVDQKMTQIMVELLMQNREIIALKSFSAHSELAVLTAAGFKHSKFFEVMKEINAFRSETQNNLFPPYKDYEREWVELKTEDLTEKNVSFSRKIAESWSEIIRKNSILTPNSSILPEYWVNEPRFN